MIKKTYSEDGTKCRVTFSVPGLHGASEASICGSFTQWEERPIPMKQRKDGSFSVTKTLDAGQRYTFRYLLDGVLWENDEAADDYVPNPYGSDDSVVLI